MFGFLKDKLKSAVEKFTKKVEEETVIEVEIEKEEKEPKIKKTKEIKKSEQENPELKELIKAVK